MSNSESQKIQHNQSNPDDEQMVILVTGGTGLVGTAIQQLVRQESSPNMHFIFTASKDVDLRCVELLKN
jgi:dTDP-4-dehydrorhamnose reductase